LDCAHSLDNLHVFRFPSHSWWPQTGLFSIIRDLVTDIGQIAFQVQQAAESVEKNAQENENLIIPVYKTIREVKDQRYQVVDGIANGSRSEGRMGDDVADKMKRKILERTKELTVFLPDEVTRKKNS
jgi:hypothetical protein